MCECVKREPPPPSEPGCLGRGRALHELITTVGGAGRFELEFLISVRRALIAELDDLARRIQDAMKAEQ